MTSRPPTGGAIRSEDVLSSCDADDAGLIIRDVPEATVDGRRRFSLNDLYAMMETGVVHEGERSELIEGELFVQEPVSALHYDLICALHDHLRAALGTRFQLATRGVFNREPETQLSPDIAVWPKGTRFRGMTPANAQLIVEVSDTTARGDKREKAPLYARAGMSELWIMDVQPRQLLVYRNAANDAWPEPTKVKPGESIAPLCSPSTPIIVPDL